MYEPLTPGALGRSIYPTMICNATLKQWWKSQNIQVNCGRENVNGLNPLPETQDISPSIKFGRVIVKNRTGRMHAVTYDEQYYYAEVINEVPNTVAQGCRGSIVMSTEQITHTAIWEVRNSKNRTYGPSLPIRSHYGGNTHIFYFPWENHKVDEEAEQSYKNRLDKNLKVFIQSDNAHFPSEPLNNTIRQFINKATQE